MWFFSQYWFSSQFSSWPLLVIRKEACGFWESFLENIDPVHLSLSLSSDLRTTVFEAVCLQAFKAISELRVGRLFLPSECVVYYDVWYKVMNRWSGSSRKIRPTLMVGRLWWSPCSYASQRILRLTPRWPRSVNLTPEHVWHSPEGIVAAHIAWPRPSISGSLDLSLVLGVSISNKSLEGADGAGPGPPQESHRPEARCVEGVTFSVSSLALATHILQPDCVAGLQGCLESLSKLFFL